MFEQTTSIHFAKKHVGSQQSLYFFITVIVDVKKQGQLKSNQEHKFSRANVLKFF